MTNDELSFVRKGNAIPRLKRHWNIPTASFGFYFAALILYTDYII